MPVVVTRDKDGKLNAFENRCAHRGSLLVLNERGEAKDIICVYHNWSYDLAGNLTAVAFRHGPAAARAACRRSAGRRRKARASCASRRSAGLVFGTLSADTPPLEHYLGPDIMPRIRRVMRAPVSLLGGYSQVLPNNWKLYMENVKDTYHASLLHTFFTTFRLNRLSQKGGVIISESGGHHVSYSMAADVSGKEYEQAGMRSAQAGFLSWRRPSCCSRSTSSATGSACRSCPCSRISFSSRSGTAWRCGGWCRRASRTPSWRGPLSASPATTQR